jgi:two-component system sensor histidine kinase GlrK
LLVFLVPLALLVGYSQIKLSEIGQIATYEAEYSVNTVRRVSKMEGLSVDIERLASAPVPYCKKGRAKTFD